MHILQVNQHDSSGGAAKIAHKLHHMFLSAGHSSWLAVSYKSKADKRVVQIPDLPPANHTWVRLIWWLRKPWEKRIGKRGTGIAMRALRALAYPHIEIERRKGHEDFDFPGSRKLLNLIPEKPEIIHLHNLHNDYFDLRYLPELSKKIPILITLHDEWLMTGHCAYTLGCKRWKIGCGQCQSLATYPKIPRDATNFNWQRKKEIYEQCRFYVTAPSQWLMKKVKESILAPAIVGASVIPNGVDQRIFAPRAKAEIRNELKLPVDVKIVLFILAKNFKRNQFKDFKTTKDAISIIMKSKTGKNIMAIGVGSEDAVNYFNQQDVKIIPYIKDERQLAKYYQAADVFIHAAYSDNFPTTILESLSCGTPVVASEVGGIPEQVEQAVNGFLVGKKNPQEMADRTLKIISNDDLHVQLSKGALSSARLKFSFACMGEAYERLYFDMIGRSNKVER